MSIMFSPCNPCCFVGKTTFFFSCSNVKLAGATVHATSPTDSYVIDGITDANGQLTISRTFATPATYTFTVTHPTLGAFPNWTVTLSNSGTFTYGTSFAGSDTYLCCYNCPLPKKTLIANLTFSNTSGSVCNCTNSTSSTSTVGDNTFWANNFQSILLNGGTPPTNTYYVPMTSTLTKAFQATPCPWDTPVVLPLPFVPIPGQFQSEYSSWYNGVLTTTNHCNGVKRVYDASGHATDTAIFAEIKDVTVITHELQLTLTCLNIGLKDRTTSTTTHIVSGTGIAGSSTDSAAIVQTVSTGLTPTVASCYPLNLIAVGGGSDYFAGMLNAFAALCDYQTEISIEEE